MHIHKSFLFQKHATKINVFMRFSRLKIGFLRIFLNAALIGSFHVFFVYNL